SRPGAPDPPALRAPPARAADEPDSDRALRRHPAAARAARARLAVAAAPERARLVRLLGRFATSRPELAPLLVALARDEPDPKARRNAIIALGKIPGPASEAALLALLADPATPLPQRRPAVDAPGHIRRPAPLAALVAPTH